MSAPDSDDDSTGSPGMMLSYYKCQYNNVEKRCQQLQQKCEELEQENAELKQRLRMSCMSCAKPSPGKKVVMPAMSLSPLNKEPSPTKSPILGWGKSWMKREKGTGAVRRNLSKTAAFENHKRTRENSPPYVYKGSAVRGKTRKSLPATTCNDCKQFYRAAGLDANAVQDCSRHRSRNPPRPQTPPGFWDPHCPSTQFMLEKQLAPFSD